MDTQSNMGIKISLSMNIKGEGPLVTLFTD